MLEELLEERAAALEADMCSYNESKYDGLICIFLSHCTHRQFIRVLLLHLSAFYRIHGLLALPIRQQARRPPIRQAETARAHHHPAPRGRVAGGQHGYGAVPLAFFALVFITSQGYFTAICWDLWRTLGNPFRPPAADSPKLHLCVWIAAGCLVSPFGRSQHHPDGIFRYRETYGICFSCNTGANLNFYNFILFSAPVFVANLVGIASTVYAFRRLANGLEKTFELRQKIIKRQLVLVGGLLHHGVSWGVLFYAPTFEPAHAVHQVSDRHRLVPQPQRAVRRVPLV